MIVTSRRSSSAARKHGGLKGSSITDRCSLHGAYAIRYHTLAHSLVTMTCSTSRESRSHCLHAAQHFALVHVTSRRGRTRHIACHALLQNAHSIAALGVMGSASGSAAAEGPARALPAPTSTAGAACLPERLQVSHGGCRSLCLLEVLA